MKKRLSNKGTLKLIAGACICLSSCEGANYVDYNLTNSATYPLNVVFSSWAYKDSMYITKDSSFVLPPNKTVTLTTRSIISGVVFNPEEGLDTVWMFPRLELRLRDTIAPKQNLKSTRYWHYEAQSRHHAKLELRVLDEQFR